MEQLNSSSLIPVSAHSAVNKVKSVIAFSSNFGCKSKKNPSDLLGISHSNSKNRDSASSK